MLSPEQHALEAARRERLFKDYLGSADYQKKLLERAKINDACKRSALARDATWKMCERPDNTVEGIKFFINNFGFTFSPKTDPKHLPFILFDYQENAIQWLVDKIEGKHDGLIEKSREMGMTWLIFVAVPLYYWLFRDGINILVGSYKESLVDDRTDDSIFGKIDYFIRGLPTWMLPRGFKTDKHRQKLKLVNPANNNLISGDTMNPNFGRGSRKTAVLFDELGFWDYAKDAWESCSDTTECRIANSTPHGYDYYAQLKESGMAVLSLLWKLHPLKDQAWYEYEKQRRTAEELAQEVDMSYSKSQEGRVYPEWNEDNIEKGYFPYDPDLSLYVGWDFGKSDDTAIIWCQRTRNNKIRIIDTYKKTGKNIDWFVPLVTGFIVADNGYVYSPEELEIIEEHKNWRRATHFGDPAGRFSNQVSDETVIDVLRKNGIVVNFKDHWKEFKIRKREGKNLIMSGIELNLSPRNKYFEICMINSAYPRVKVNGVDEVRSEKPKHDGYSHYRSAFEYLALGLSEVSDIAPRPFDKFPVRETLNNKFKSKVIHY